MSMELDNAMRRNVMSLPGLMKDQVYKVEALTRMVFRNEEVFGIRRIIITGCGDSLAAGRAAKFAFEHLADIPTEVMTSLDVSRFLSSRMLNLFKTGTLVIAVSSSGKPTRTVEALERAGRYGALTLAVTGNPESPLAKVAKKVVKMEIPAFEAGNGVRSFMMSLLALYTFAIRFGEIKCRYPMTYCEELRQDFMHYADEVEKALPSLDEKMLGLAKRVEKKKMYDFIASGPSAATAWFAHAKIVEATGDWASENGIEDWFHLNCFLREYKDIFTMIITQTGGEEKSRVQELLDALREMQREVWIVTEDDDYTLPENTEEIRLPKAPKWWMSPLFNQIPVSLLAGYLCELRGERYGRGCVGPWAICESADLLTKSRKEIW